MRQNVAKFSKQFCGPEGETGILRTVTGMSGRISDLAHLAAQKFGDAVAFSLLGGESWTFAQIDKAASGFAAALVARGVGRGDRVVLYLPNCAEWLVAYHAIARLGAVAAPVNILLHPDEVAFILSDSQAAAIVLPTDRRAEIMAAVGHPSDLLLIEWNRAGADWLRAPEGPYFAPADVASEDLFSICYTSGTTGRPKGAMLTHGNVFVSTAQTATIHARSCGETVLTALPFPHVYGNVIMNAAFLVGMRLLAMPRFDAEGALRAIETERPALFEGVPTMFYQMLAHPRIGETDFSSLRRCTVGGQTMPTAKIDEVVNRFGCPLCELWGMTEVAGPAISHSPYWPPRHGSIGLPFPTLEVRIADLEHPERDAHDGEAGELFVRGPQVTPGYWRNRDATEHAIDPQGWFATGDIGIREADGYLRIVDRRKDLIITGGYNVYPAELEQVLAMHPSVAMVAVAGISDPEKGELAKAYVVLRPNQACEAVDLDRHCRRHLAPYKVPRLFAFVSDLPKTSTGKILRRALGTMNLPS